MSNGYLILEIRIWSVCPSPYTTCVHVDSEQNSKLKHCSVRKLKKKLQKNQKKKKKNPTTKQTKKEAHNIVMLVNIFVYFFFI